MAIAVTGRTTEVRNDTTDPHIRVGQISDPSLTKFPHFRAIATQSNYRYRSHRGQVYGINCLEQCCISIMVSTPNRKQKKLPPWQGHRTWWSKQCACWLELRCTIVGTMVDSVRHQCDSTGMFVEAQNSIAAQSETNIYVCYTLFS